MGNSYTGDRDVMDAHYRSGVVTSVVGRCPACNSRSLFVGSGGYVTCGWADCPDPSAADKLLAVGQPLAAAIRDLVAAAILMEQQ